RAGRPILRVAHERMAQHVERDAELQSYAGHDRAISRSGIAVAAGLAVAEKDLGELAVGKPPDRADVAQTAGLKFERLGLPAVWQTTARGHRSTPSRRSDASAWSILSAVSTVAPARRSAP